MNDDKGLPWNYQVVFTLPSQSYNINFRVMPKDTWAEVEKKIDSMTEYTDARSVIERIKTL